MKKYSVAMLVFLLGACAPAAAVVKSASADTRLVVNADSGAYQRDMLNFSAERLKQIGYTVMTSTAFLSDYGKNYNDTLSENLNNALKLIGEAKANYAVFIYLKLENKDPPPFSGFTAYREAKSTLSVVDSKGKLVKRLEVIGADGSRSSSNKESEAATAAIKAAMNNTAVAVNTIINP
jgi:hypothetical protein